MPSIPIIPPKTPSPLRPIIPSTQRSGLPSQKIKPGYDDVNKDLDNANKDLDDLVNNIKSKQSRDLVNKKVNDIVNNIGNRRLDSPDVNISPDVDLSLDFDSLRDLVDRTNKDNSDQIDFDKLIELTKARLLKLGNLKTEEPEDYSNIFRSSSRARARACAPVSKMKKK